MRNVQDISFRTYITKLICSFRYPTTNQTKQQQAELSQINRAAFECNSKLYDRSPQ